MTWPYRYPSKWKRITPLQNWGYFCSVFFTIHMYVLVSHILKNIQNFNKILLFCYNYPFLVILRKKSTNIIFWSLQYIIIIEQKLNLNY